MKVNKKEIAWVVLLGLISPFIALAAFQYGYRQAFPVGFPSVDRGEANSHKELGSTDI